MDFAFLAAYIALLALAYARARSAVWLVITIAGAGALAGAGMAFAHDLGVLWTRTSLQWLALAVLAVVAVLAWVPFLGFSTRAQGTELGRGGDLGLRRQFLALWLPILLVVLAFIVMSTFWTKDPAFLKPVGFLIGHGTAEDNAKWLDFTSQFASGREITQGVPMGGPLALLLTVVGTAMGVVSRAVLGGYNEVAVAANTVVYTEFLMVALVLVALAPLVESRVRGNRLPLPIIWVSMIALAALTMVLIGFGHLTLQFTIMTCVLWSAVFLSAVRMRRARLLTSLAVAACMTVWLPLNVVAVMVLGGWAVVLIARLVRSRDRDVVGLVLTVLVGIGLAKPILSSLSYSLGISAAPAIGGSGGAVGGVVAAVSTHVVAGLTESPVFGAQGGTEQVGPLLAVAAIVVAIGAALYLKPAAGPLPSSLLRRFLPIGLLALTAMAIYSLDFWSTGEGPHYGSLKFTYLTAVVIFVSCLPLALALLDPGAGSRMSQMRWIGIGAVLVLLTVDSVLPRAIALGRPQQWSPPIPFNNTSGSYWYPAEVNGTGQQSIATNPVACVYLPKDSPFPTAIVQSGLSDAQRVYNCTRQLAGLSGSDSSAQFIVDWLRREWYTNTPAWTDVYDGLAGLPADVLAKPVILLDDGSNVKGIESLQSLLQRFPKPVA